jgi:outer membrane cobalamin receptor
MTNNRMRKVLFIFIFLGVFSLHAQTFRDSLTTPEVVVTGTPVKVNKEYVPLSVSIVTRDQIVTSGESSLLPVLNGRIPGLFVTEKGITGFGVSSGAAGQITMRGVGGSPTTGVLMLIDGHPQYMGLFGHPLADSYITSDVERVEVIRGPASILYGSNAMGGVVNILTRRTRKEGVAGEAGAQYGSYNTQKYFVNGSYRRKRLNLFASFNRNSTDGHRANSDFNLTSGYLKVGYMLNDHFRLHADANLTQFKTTDPGPDTLGAVVGNALDILRGYWAFSMDHDHERFSGSARVFNNFGTHDISDGFHSDDRNSGLNLSESFRFSKSGYLSVGLDVNQYGGEALQTRTSAVLVDTMVWESGLYGFAQHTLFDCMTLNAGVRLQHHSRYGQEWIPSAGMAWKIAEGTTWKVSMGKGFRSPSLRELFMWNHNPDLAPERIWNYETSFYKDLMAKKLQLELTAFYVQGDNLIVTGAMGRLYNGGRVHNKGLEFTTNYQASDKLSFQLAYSYIHMQNPVYATPRNHLFLSGQYAAGRFGFSGGVRVVNHLNTVASVSSIPSFEDYVLLNVQVSCRVCEHADIYLNGNNLLNQRYETIRYYTMPGALLHAGLRIRF